MIGAGIFAAVGPAAAVAGSWLLPGLVLAGIVAYANATSSAQLAAIYPESGGTYVYARERLGSYWGFLAGWGFVVGKTAGLAAMALTFGAYVSPTTARPLGVAAVAVVTAVNYRGVKKGARLAAVIVGIVLVTLAVVVAGLLGGGEATLTNLAVDASVGWFGMLQSAGLLFFAFAGYARIATLGEEVRDPRRTIPRAIPIALFIALAVYLLVMGSALVAVGPRELAAASAPLTAAVEAGRWSEIAPAVQVGSAVASLGVLLTLTAGVSRTVFAMARRRELPGFLEAIHPRRSSPHRAEIAVAIAVCIVVLVVDLRDAIGFSSFAVLTYYALANASALTLPKNQLRWPRPIAALGLVGCLVLAVTLPLDAVVGGSALLAAGSVVWLVRR